VLGGDYGRGQERHATAGKLLGQMPPAIQFEPETRQGADPAKATFRAFNGEGYIKWHQDLIDGVPSKRQQRPTSALST